MTRNKFFAGKWLDRPDFASHQQMQEDRNMSFGLYALGYAVVIVGILYIAHLMHIPQQWIIGIGILLVGMGILGGVRNTRQKDPN